jgi:hypothetical protein
MAELKVMEENVGFQECTIMAYVRSGNSTIVKRAKAFHWPLPRKVGREIASGDWLQEVRDSQVFDDRLFEGES